MTSDELHIGDEIVPQDSQTGNCYVVVSSTPQDRWVICLSRETGWHYAFRKMKVNKTGRHYTFSDRLKREIENAMAYRYHIPEKLLTDQHIILSET